MKRRSIAGAALVVALLSIAGCQDEIAAPYSGDAAFAKGGIPGPPQGKGETTAGANLSFPTIWAEGVTKSPRGTMEVVVLNGAWWWWWGEAAVEGGDPLACAPDPDDSTFCDDGIPFKVTGALPGPNAVKTYLQRQPLNEWQADNVSGAASPVNVDWIDWGDALEAVPWTLNSKVRVETTLFKDLTESMTGYFMHHLYGHGMDEMWGVENAGGTAVSYESLQAIIFSPCARLTIQKLLVPREDVVPLDPRLVWNAVANVWQDATAADLINETAVFNGALAPEGPSGGYGAEINIQGKVVFGYTWDVRTLNQGAADYRITFSLADGNCAAVLNTFIVPATQIVVPEEEIVIAAEGSGGGSAVVDGANNLSYIDIRITSKSTGGGGGNGPRR